MRNKGDIIMLTVPRDLDYEIANVAKKKYRSRQEFILECVREKLQKMKELEAKA